MKRLFAAILTIAATLCAGQSSAAMSTPQQQALKAAALADPVASQYVTNPSPDNDRALADWYNATGTCVVWKSNVPIRDIYDKTSSAGTTWDWTTFIANTTAAERDAWAAMSSQGGTISPSLQQVRDGWAKIFSGTGASVVAQRAHLSAIGQRSGSRAESTLAVGSCTALSPAVMSYEGQISQGEASTIRSLP